MVKLGGLLEVSFLGLDLVCVRIAGRMAVVEVEVEEHVAFVAHCKASPLYVEAASQDPAGTRVDYAAAVVVVAAYGSPGDVSGSVVEGEDCHTLLKRDIVASCL